MMMLRNFCIIFSFVVFIPFVALAQASAPMIGDSDKPIEITADTLTVKRQNEIAVFSGNVDAIQGNVHLRSDVMTVYYRSSKNKQAAENSISKIDVDGNVFLSTPGETAKGDKGTYNVDTKIINLNGSVVLTQKANVVKGDRLVYDMSTGKSELFSDAPSPGKPSGGRVRGLFVPEKKE